VESDARGLSVIDEIERLDSQMDVVPGSRPGTFVNDVLAGKASEDDIINYVRQWHDSTGDPSIGGLEIDEYLGMSWDEYRLWVEQVKSLEFLIIARREGITQLMASERAAAEIDQVHPERQSTAQSILLWLRELGRIE
jgi:hypothetical protein